jgi:hypothetical protein
MIGNGTGYLRALPFPFQNSVGFKTKTKSAPCRPRSRRLKTASIKYMRDGAKSPRQRSEAPPAELLYRIPSHDKNG